MLNMNCSCGGEIIKKVYKPTINNVPYGLAKTLGKFNMGEIVEFVCVKCDKKYEQDFKQMGKSTGLSSIGGTAPWETE